MGADYSSRPIPMSTLLTCNLYDEEVYLTAVLENDVFTGLDHAHRFGDAFAHEIVVHFVLVPDHKVNFL